MYSPKLPVHFFLPSYVLHVWPAPPPLSTADPNSTNYDAPQYAVLCHLLPLRPHYNPQHPILQHPSLSSSFNVRDQVLHPHKTTDKIRVLCSLIFIFSESEEQDKRLLHNTLGPGVWPTCTAAQQLWPVAVTSRASSTTFSMHCATSTVCLQKYHRQTDRQTVCEPLAT